MSELETRLEKVILTWREVTRGGIKMRGVRPGRKLETKSEFRGLLNANQVG